MWPTSAPLIPTATGPPMHLFPHDKLDWSLRRHEERLERTPDDANARLEYAASLLSKAQFHDGGEPKYNSALAEARRVLQQDPGSVPAMVIAGLCLVGLDRIEPASRYLDEALKREPERADVHLAYGVFHQGARRVGDPAGDRHQAIREFEMACRLAPEAWEPHALLAMALWERATDLGGPGAAPRLLERSQFHTVRALELGAATSASPALVYHLGITCLHTTRFEDAAKLLTRLLDDSRYRSRAQYYLGLVYYRMGKHKNAVLSLRQHLDNGPESARVHARIGMCYLQLGEVVKAREACNRALAIDADDLQARWTLGCALVEEGREDEAVKMFKAILEDAPDHAPAFAELTRTRSRRGDTGWLRKALRAEVGVFDRLPVAGPGPDPRATTLTRIQSVLGAMEEVDEDAVGPILAAMDLTSDERLRFTLWEAALDHESGRRARSMARRLKEPGTQYDAAAGREVLALAHRIQEPLLVAGLQIDEEDLRRAAVDRHGPARDVSDHRMAIDAERRQARAWQALLLLAIASHGNPSSRKLLMRWGAEADADLADAANAALIILGDDGAAEALRKRAKSRGVGHLVDAMEAQVAAPHRRHPVRPAATGESSECTTCGRRTHDVDLMLIGAQAAVCNHCLTHIAQHRRELETEDPEAVCALSRLGRFESAALYVHNGIGVSRQVVDHGLGLLEREAIDRYLGAV